MLRARLVSRFLWNVVTALRTPLEWKVTVPRRKGGTWDRQHRWVYLEMC